MSAEAIQELVPVSKTTKNVISEVAQEIEGLTKTKALNEAQRLSDNIEQSFFKLGGVLKVIQENGWFEGHETFDAYVAAKFEFQPRKARYLIDIYVNLVSKQIPYEKVSGLGWTKLTVIGSVLTQENVDEWVAKASSLTVAQLKALLAPPTGEGTSSTKTTGTTTKMSFSLHVDQVETVQSALNKAKAEGSTEYDNVALELICAGYLSGASSVSAGGDLASQMKQLGWKDALLLYGEVFPGVDLSVEKEPQE